MNKMKLTIATAIGIVSLAGSSHAQTVSAQDGDLLLGFRASGGNGSALNLEVNLGAYSNFNMMNGSTFTLSQLSPLDLSGTYGNGTSTNPIWSSRTDLVWSVDGTSYNNGGTGDATGLQNNTYFTTAIGGSTPNYKRQTSNSQLGVSQNMDGFTAGLNGSTTTANSSSSSLVNKSGGNSYDATISNGGAFTRPWGANTTGGLTFAKVENNTNIPTGSFVSEDLYEFDPTASGTANAVLLGQFRLFDTGVLTFTEATAAVPEPSTYAAGALAAIVLAAMTVRRRNTAAKLA
jgi:hypothetical protein